MTDPVPDEDLVVQVARGYRQAFIALYDRHASRVFALAMRMLGEQMAAEEVTQDAFLKLWTRADTYSPHKGSLVAWLLTITRRTALDHLRLEKRRPDFENPKDPQEAWHLLPDVHSSTQESRWRSLYFAVQDLPEEQRQVIELAYYQGLSHRQIAEYLDIPLGTTKTRMRLGMEKLRQGWIIDRSNSSE